MTKEFWIVNLIDFQESPRFKSVGPFVSEKEARKFLTITDTDRFPTPPLIEKLIDPNAIINPR